MAIMLNARSNVYENISFSASQPPDSSTISQIAELLPPKRCTESPSGTPWPRETRPIRLILRANLARSAFESTRTTAWRLQTQVALELRWFGGFLGSRVFGPVSNVVIRSGAAASSAAIRS